MLGVVIENLPANEGDVELQVWSLGLEDPLVKSMSTHFSILAWRIQWTEEPRWWTTVHISTLYLHFLGLCSELTQQCKAFICQLEIK